MENPEPIIGHANLKGNNMNLPKYVRHSRSGKNNVKYGIWLCGCGEEFEARNTHIRGGQLSCGCMRVKPPIKIVHGLSKAPEYKAWGSMMARCYKINHVAFSRYGARGIDVCTEWHNAEVFCSWAKKNGYAKGLQLDRIDNNHGYEPSNCRFVTCSENCMNKSGTYWWHTPDGVFPSLKLACEHYGRWIAKRFDRYDMKEYYKVAKYENN